MNILGYIINAVRGISANDDMVRFYRTEYSREWKQCRELLPTFSDRQIANSCFKGRFD